MRIHACTETQPFSTTWLPCCVVSASVACWMWQPIMPCVALTGIRRGSGWLTAVGAQGPNPNNHLRGCFVSWSAARHAHDVVGLVQQEFHGTSTTWPAAQTCQPVVVLCCGMPSTWPNVCLFVSGSLQRPCRVCLSTSLSVGCRASV